MLRFSISSLAVVAGSSNDLYNDCGCCCWLLCSCCCGSVGSSDVADVGSSVAAVRAAFSADRAPYSAAAPFRQDWCDRLFRTLSIAGTLCALPSRCSASAFAFYVHVV